MLYSEIQEARCTQKLFDKLVILGLCLFVLSLTHVAWVSVIALLAAMTVSSLCSYFENRISGYLCAAYVILCLFSPQFIIFLPLIVYDCTGFDSWILRLCWIVPLLFSINILDLHTLIAIVLFCGVAFVLQYRTASLLQMREAYFVMADDSKERAIHLEQKNNELMEKQDYDIRLATLAERNRIAREIHDNVGHLLTRSILQLGAMNITHGNDNLLTDELHLVKDTLSDAMDNIRASVHDLHEESIDLRLQLGAMIDGFNFCNIKLHFDAGELPSQMQYCFIAIVREALNNIARHSNATEVVISVTEHPAFCQLIIEDNGESKTNRSSGGIGLINMADRVDSLGGIFRTDQSKGFKIFISIPKKKV